MKNIIICMDGTGNEYGVNITNVVETYKIVLKSKKQYAFYDPGVGTGGYHYDEGTGKVKAAYDSASGKGVHKNVEQAYTYLMGVYEPGDKIFLFGFSRGSFEARSLAGMLYKIGLLPAKHENQLEYASKYYLDKKFHHLCSGFKTDFCRPCPVHFIGVWDTVDSTLLHEGAHFTNTKLNPEISHAYHAMSIDERRRNFPVSLWDEKNKSSNQKMQQVWFSGVHSDVGGWYDERDLSSIPLCWMLKKAKRVGLILDDKLLSKKQKENKPLGVIHESYKGFWKFLRSNRRVISEHANIHKSVITRKDKMSSYNPKLPKKYTVVS